MAVPGQHRPPFQLLDHLRRQPLLAQTAVRPDTFDLRGVAIFRFISAGGDNFSLTLKDDKQPLRRQIPLSQLHFRIAGKIVAVAGGIFGKQPANNRLQLRCVRRNIAECFAHRASCQSPSPGGLISDCGILSTPSPQRLSTLA